ncbi:MAG: hypothetical protein JWN02_12 [Acidobacteria bacterium]|nr:hypothetical protein [Acidobacteriota bacterium]
MGQRRPWLVWLIAGFFVYQAVTMTVAYGRGYMVVRSRHVPITLPLAVKCFAAAGVGVGLLASIQLLRLQRNSVSLFLLSLLVTAALLLYQVLHFLSSRERHAVLVTFAAFLLLNLHAFFFVYALHLRKKGILVDDR